MKKGKDFSKIIVPEISNNEIHIMYITVKQNKCYYKKNTEIDL